MAADDFVGSVVERIDGAGQGFTELAYGIINNDIKPLLTVMIVLYVAYYGLQLLMGTAQVSVGTIVWRIVRMIIIYTFAMNWEYFNDFFYKWLTTVPENVGKALLLQANTGITEPTNGLSAIWKAASEAADAFARQSGYLTILPSIIGGIILIGAAIFIAVALAILVLAKMAMWVLMATAPIFIACLMFDTSRQYATAWFNQVVAYAVIPLFVYVVLAFLIFAINPELNKLTAAAESSEIFLGQIGGFLMLVAAGVFVLININSLAQGVAGGITMGVGQMAGRVVGGGLRWGGGKAYNGGKTVVVAGVRNNVESLDRMSAQMAESGGRIGRGQSAMQHAIANNAKIRT